MKSFKKFLVEVKRDYDRAKKLADNLLVRQHLKKKMSHDSMQIGAADIDAKTAINCHLSKRYPKHANMTTVTILKHNEPKAPVKTFDIEDLKVTQSHVYHSGVLDKMRGIGHGDHGPIRVATYNKQHYVVDGHTRLAAARLKGETTIDGYHHKVRKAK
jgi:hypothetical protein